MQKRRKLAASWCLSFLFLIAQVGKAGGHEFWLYPNAWLLEKDQELRVDLRVGTEFTGYQKIYLPDHIRRFDLTGPNSQTPFKGRLGDRPAGKIIPKEDGLHIIAHVTAFSSLTYETLDKFEAFATEKGYPDAVLRHRARLLAEQNFSEDYRRFAKSLVAVNSAAGQDRVLGLEVEITALQNPFVMQGDLLELRLDRDGRPWSNVQVTVLARSLELEPGTTTKTSTNTTTGITSSTTRYRTDENGRIKIRTALGHEYLVDAVSLDPIDPQESKSGAVWLSRWASLTFARPAFARPEN